MTVAFKDHFSQVAKAYRVFRPEYPAELFRWLAHIAPQRESALDCGCGTGQAAVAMARHFRKVYAIDPSAEQIANAMHDEKVTYQVAPAENTGLPEESQDVVIAAQALHWFDLDLYYPEVTRIARQGAIFTAFTYGLVTVNPAADNIIKRLYYDILGRYWPPERRHVDEGYRTLPFPFREITPPELVMTANWDMNHVLGYLATWSAVKEFRAQTASDPLKATEEELREVWEQDEVKTISWPLFIRAGIIRQ